MTSLLLSGAGGRMGRAVAQLALADPQRYHLVGGVDPNPPTDSLAYPVVSSYNQLPLGGKVLIDFSSPLALNSLLDYGLENSLPLVLATTGYTQKQLEKINEAGEEIPIFFTPNMSLGVSLLAQLCQQAAKVLGLDYNIEIIEKHHNQKLDAPSGTALFLADAIKESSGENYHYITDRSTVHQKREPLEIGLHSVRGGTIVGEHDVIFAGNNEVITLSHTAQSRDVFATGALKAAEFIANQPSGLYSMKQLLEN